VSATERATPEAAAAGPALGGRALRGAAVVLTGQGLKIALQVLSVVVLSRLLLPRDYGLVAMVTAVIGIADIFRDLGLSTAAIQARVLTAGQRANLFWINTAVGLLLGLAALAAAPLLAAAYGHPELEAICRVLAVIFVLNGLATQYRADLTRHLRFGWLTAADVVAALGGFGAALVLALAGAGYWALVGQQVTQYVLMLSLVAVAGRWRPTRPDRDEDMDGLLRFGWHMVGTQLIGYVANNADSVVIGARFGAGPLGLYNRAFQLLMTPLGQIRSPSTQVALPVLSAVQDDDERLAHYAGRGQLAMGYTLIAGLGVVVGAAPHLVAVLLGEQWQEATPLLALFALAGALQTLGYVNYWVYLARGLTGALLRYSLVQASIKITCILVGSHWGVVGVAAGYALAPALSWPVSFWWLSRATSLPMRPLVASAGRVLVVLGVVTAGSGGAGRLVAEGSPWLALGAAVAGGLAAYGLTCSLVPALRRDCAVVLAVVRRGVSRPRSPRP
jgi:PST family polysaccharide transporter